MSKRCVTCGKGMMQAGTVPHHEKIAGRVFAADLPALVCKECNEALVDQDALEAFGELAAATIADSGDVSSETFRAMRVALGLNGRAVAAELGVPPETISRWERGDRDVDRFAWLVLAAMAREAVEGVHEMRDRLRAVREPPKLAKTVQLEVPKRRRAAR
jgi:putative zinc finger/helix-turn-helix YgiT family protein